MSKEFWIAMGIVSCCFITAYFTKMLIQSDIRSIGTQSYKPFWKETTADLSIEKRILILETKMAILLEERAEQAKK